MPGMELACRATGTDFCVLLSKPIGGEAPRSYRREDIKRPNDQLLRAHIDVVIDETAADREIAGMQRFAKQNYEPVALAPVRMAIMADPSRMTHSTADLTA